MKIISKLMGVSACLTLLTLPMLCAADLDADWQNPPAEFKAKPFLEWSGRRPFTVTKEGLTEILVNSKEDSNYGGMTVVPDKRLDPEFMSPGYIEVYGHYLDTLRSLGMEAILYDDKSFPSGQADGAVPIKYRARQINLTPSDVKGPASFSKEIPKGHLLGAVIMNTETKKRWNVTSNIKQNILRTEIPAGPHKVMIFTTSYEPQFKPLVNWLDPVASKKWLELTLDKYYANFSEHFGSTIKTIFFDDLSFTQTYPPQNNRLWVDNFNETFKQVHGFDPLTYYPAMWFDIGPETGWARNALFGHRATLMSEGFIKVEQEWAHKHGVKLSGHFSQHFTDDAYLHFIGDFMKNFKYVDYPGLDEILSYRMSAKKYKIATSAATNYDKEKTFIELFGIYPKDMPVNYLYKMVMEQFTKGVTRFIPHAVWYEEDNIHFQEDSELSWRSPLYGPALKNWNDYIARTARVLEGGRTVSDIAILYPIAGIWSGIYFDKADTWPEWAQWRPQEIDYLDVGENIFSQLRHEFTFIHPEILDEKVSITTQASSPRLYLQNKIQWQEYQAIVLPGSTTISLSNLTKIVKFWEAGGQVLATTKLPFLSVEKGKDRDIVELIKRMFNVDPTQSPSSARNKNTRGGLAVFTSTPNHPEFERAINEMIPLHDVTFEKALAAEGGPITYTHKVVNGKNVYYFANASDKPIETPVTFRGKLKNPEFWNPHDGVRNKDIGVKYSIENNQEKTVIQLNIPAVNSVFVIADLNE